MFSLCWTERRCDIHTVQCNSQWSYGTGLRMACIWSRQVPKALEPYRTLSLWYPSFTPNVCYDCWPLFAWVANRFHLSLQPRLLVVGTWWMEYSWDLAQISWECYNWLVIPAVVSGQKGTIPGRFLLPTALCVSFTTSCHGQPFRKPISLHIFHREP